MHAAEAALRDRRPKRRVVPARLLAAAALAVAGVALVAAPAGAASPAHANKAKVKAKVKKGVLEVTGTNASEEIVLRLRAGAPQFIEVVVDNEALRRFRLARVDEILVEARDGADVLRIDEATGVFDDTRPTTLDGEDGNDTLTGGSGAETLKGGDDDDFADGNRGDDVAFLGAGNDVFRWDPGDGSDRVEGDGGTDEMVFNGAGASENIDITANGERIRFFRDVASITMDLDNVEEIAFEALGGADTVEADSLAGTDLDELNVDLEGVSGSGTGDGQVDTVHLEGTENADAVEILGAPGDVSVVGLPFLTNVRNAEPSDRLLVDALGGDDAVTASTLPAVILLTIDGGADDDSIFGGAGPDLLLGGSENDAIDGNRGDDTAFLGAGDDGFTWDPGDGSDVVEGQAGQDEMLFNGAGVSEKIDISANGRRLRFFRDIASITMDVDGTERVEFRALGGSDSIVVGDLTGTAVTRVDNDLAGTLGGITGDGQPDTVVVNGTNGDDAIEILGENGAVAVNGLAAVVTAESAEPALDTLVVNALGGDDIVSAAALAATAIKLTVDGGAGDDDVFGGAGPDLLLGGDENDFVDGNRGDDTGLLGAGDDTFRWDPGDGSDVVEGQAGTDTLLFNGAGVSENIDVSANGSRARFFRDVATITMDLDDTEKVFFQALGGADSVVVNDLGGTDVVDVEVDLAAAIGGAVGDGQPDTVTVNGTNGDDVIVSHGQDGAATTSGLAAAVRVEHAEPALDRLVVKALAGDDVVDASSLEASAIAYTADGGEGDDVLIGGPGDEVLNGEAGDDILIGNLGADQISCGLGDDTVVSDAADTVAADCL